MAFQWGIWDKSVISGGGGYGIAWKWHCMFFVCATCMIMFRNNLSLAYVLHIICVYGFPLCVLFTRLAYIIVLMHDLPFLSFNGLCADVCVSVCVCIVQVKWVFGGGCGCPLSSRSPALRGNTPSYSLVLRPLERKWGRQLSDPPHLPQIPPKLSASRHRSTSTPCAPSVSLCFHSVNNQAVALSVPGA